MSDIFETRESLSRVRDFARARRVGPWPVLGAVMLRAVASCSPAVTIPPMTGSRASLNLFVAFVGRSGSGKGAADAVAADYCRGNPAMRGVAELPLGSGEGIAAAFVGEDAPTRAIFSTSEIDSLRAQSDRKGSTLLPELRKVAMGELIGQSNASKETRRRVEAHSYRACLSLGVQPDRARFLLDDQAGGTPQRILWLPVADPDAPDERPPEVEPIRIWHDWSVASGELSFPDCAREEIDQHRIRVLRGEGDIDPLDGHKQLTRAKVTVALMLIDNRQSVNAEDWALAGRIMAVSDWTRAHIIAEGIKAAREANRARAHAAAERDDVVSSRKVQRAMEGICRTLDRAGSPVLRSDIRRSLKSDIRPEFDPAIGELIADQIVIEYQSDRGVECGLSEVHGDHRSTPHNRRSDDGDHRSTWTTPKTDEIDPQPADQGKQEMTPKATLTTPPRATECRNCNISLPRTATDGVCDDCSDAAHRPPPEPPAATPAPHLSVIYDGTRERSGLCMVCGDQLVYASDRKDGYHTSNTKCIAGMKKRKKGIGA